MLHPQIIYSTRALFIVFCSVFPCEMLPTDHKGSKTTWVVMFDVELGYCANTVSYHCFCLQRPIGNFIYVCCWQDRH